MAVGGVGGSRSLSPIPPNRRNSEDGKVSPKDNLGEHTVSSSDSSLASQGPTIEERKAQLGGTDKIPLPSVKEPGDSQTSGRSGVLQRIWKGVKGVFKKTPQARPEVSSPRLPSHVQHGQRLPGFEGLRDRIQKRSENPEADLGKFQRSASEGDLTTQGRDSVGDAAEDSRSEGGEPSSRSSSFLSGVRGAASTVQGALGDAKEKVSAFGEQAPGAIRSAPGNIRTRFQRSSSEGDLSNVNKAAKHLRKALENLEKVAPEQVSPEVASGVQSLLARMEQLTHQEPPTVEDLITFVESNVGSDSVEYASLDLFATPGESGVRGAGDSVEYASIVPQDGSQASAETAEAPETGGVERSAAQGAWKALRDFVVSIFQAVASFFRAIASRLSSARRESAVDDLASESNTQWFVEQEGVSNPSAAPSLSFAEESARRAAEMSNRNAQSLEKLESGNVTDPVIQQGLGLARSFAPEGQ
ncbi:conserved hypothetical protein [Chlamydia pneumoniae LPCoLN]|uniref:hypothetical protein n=1 Tax=Chlamydia pneumoniae TaxID=83558 RepID=UPI0001BD9B7D|nr:hypothetical protein [Chlamydia pneumoniae]ACZ33450.1 conserved hypothetical protein [Chlamydia pneumoniae LPCoLN]ETR80370.1 hypothetical protein X556_0302 [Chlamydia pneumoniae B21]